MAFPYCNQADIVHAEPRLAYEKRHWDDERFERTQRRNGAYQCPKCGLWWPLIEEPDMWTEADETPGWWTAEGWWGGVACEGCEILMVSQPDGRGECYDLSGS